MGKRTAWPPLFLLGALALAGAQPAGAADSVEIVQVKPTSPVIRGVTDGQVSNRPGEYLEITVRYNLESDCPVSGGAGFVDGYWGLQTEDPPPFDILPGPDDSVITELIERTGRGRVKFRWSFQCHPDAPDLVSGYEWILGAALKCSTGELDFVEPVVGLDRWVIDCS
jgi:hypothetical protein